MLIILESITWVIFAVVGCYIFAYIMAKHNSMVKKIASLILFILFFNKLLGNPTITKEGILEAVFRIIALIAQ